MKSKSVDIYVFSGTGNTFSLVKTVADILNDNNVSTFIYPIPGEFVPPESENTALGLAFTTAWFSSYPFVLSFIKKLPKGKGREAFMISSMAGSCFGMPEAIRRILVKKGYNPIAYSVIKMPSNYSKNNRADSLTNQDIIKDATFKAANFAGNLLVGKTSWEESFAPWAKLMYKFAQTKAPWKIFRKMFPMEINQKKCIQCGFCQKICPNSSIEKDEAGYHITENCVSCQHCAAYCPQLAISIQGNVTAYKLIEYKDMIAQLYKKRPT